MADIIESRKPLKLNAEFKFALLLYGMDEVIKEYLDLDKLTRKEQEKITDPQKMDDQLVLKILAHFENPKSSGIIG